LNRIDPVIGLRFGTDKKQSHRASIGCWFSKDFLFYGFDLTDSLQEGKVIEKKLKNTAFCSSFYINVLKLKDYSIYLPSSGISAYIPIINLNIDGIKLLFSTYKPSKNRDTYFRIMRDYDGDTLSVDKLSDILEKDFKKFKFLLHYCPR
jgi:hypothetical protein